MTYPEVSEIRTEWTPEQVALTESERKAHEVQQQRLEFWRKFSRQDCADCGTRGIILEWGKIPRTCNRCQGSGWELIRRPIPTACPKR